MAVAAPLPGSTELERLRLIAIVESSDDAIVSKDLDGVVRSWNPAAERIFGWSAAEMVGQPIFKVIPPELHDEEHALLARIRLGEHLAHYETDRLRKDGRRVRISLTLSPLRDSEGRLIGASAIKRDVTNERLLEARLQQAQRMEAVGRLAGGIAHDFNNLLTVIGGLSSLVLTRLGEETRERRDLEQVLRATERATALTQQLLTFSRRQIASNEVLELEPILHNLDALLRRLIGEQLVLRTLIAPDLGRVRGNRAQLEQIVMNLALNARDATFGPGTITIQAENVRLTNPLVLEGSQLAPGPYVLLSVTDTGTGMDPATRARVFEPFFTTKAPGEGTGLGLATVYAIVQQAKGGIDVRSEVGRGSSFAVYLPRVEADAPAAPPAPPMPSRRERSETVLLVEDEVGVRGFAAQVLEEDGFRVVQAGSGEEALTVAATLGAPVSMLLTDVVMPGMNGRTLAERLRLSQPSLPVVYMSGYTDDIVVRMGVQAERTGYLQKPFSPDGLRAAVRGSLATAG